MHNVLEYVGLLSPIGSVAAVFWAATRAWHASTAAIANLSTRVTACAAEVEGLGDKIHSLSERVARVEERIRGQEILRESSHRRGYDY